MIETIYKVFVPTGLVILMFGMGLQLLGSDWLRLAYYPRAVVAGLLSQLILMPLVAFALVYFLSLPLAVAAGIVILAACPGGVVSNSVSYLARADIPLSVTLTALSSVLALVTVPVAVDLGLTVIQLSTPVAAQADAIHLPLGATVKQLLLVVLLPLSAGMLVRRFSGSFALRADRWFRIGSVVVLSVLLIGAVALEFEFFAKNFKALWPVLLSLNLATMLGGYLVARAFRLGEPQRLTIAIETGIQNVALGVLIALSILQKPEWMVASSVYSIVMMLTSFLLIGWVNVRRIGATA